MRALISSVQISRLRRAAFAALAPVLLAPAAVAQDRAPQTVAVTSSETTSAAPAVEGVGNEAFWTGVRFGAFVPYGGLYAEQSLTTTPFQDVATGGPGVEFDVGLRFARRFVGYGFFEHAWLGRGTSPAWTNPHDGQLSASTQAIGIGLRWISTPERLGFVADVGLSYRWFTARWADATAVQMSGFGDVRLGLGANWCIARHWALVPMASVYTGAFSERTLDGRPLGESSSSYLAAALTLGAHMDL